MFVVPALIQTEPDNKGMCNIPYESDLIAPNCKTALDCEYKLPTDGKNVIEPAGAEKIFPP